MPDHFHILVEIEKSLKEDQSSAQKTQEMSDFMQSLNNNYTKYYNGRYNLKGHLFRERYKSAIIQKENNLLKMTAYLHLNPEKLNLAQDAKEYPYSSYQLYLYNDPVKQADLQFLRDAVNEALSFLGNQSYAEFVRGLDPEEGASIHKRLNRGGILGSEEFVAMVKSEVEAYQAGGLGQKLEVNARNYYKLFFVLGSVVFVLVASLGGIYFVSLRKKVQTLSTTEVAAKAAHNQLDALNSSEWQVKIIGGPQKPEDADILTFLNGKFISARMNSLGYPGSNYSIAVQEDNKVVWETMQSSASGIVSWHGELEQDKMTGVISLRENGKDPQDFSFVSIAHRRKK
jgi:hypothetical protein